MKNKAAQTLGRLGGQARAARLSDKQKSDSARRAAKARWKNHKTKSRH